MDALAGSIHCTVVHLGLPIGTVDMPEGRRWAGGLLTTAAGFASVAGAVDAARQAGGAVLPITVLKLPPNAPLPTDSFSAEAAAALRALAALEFELRDDRGARVPTDCVRVADPGDGLGVRVYAYFANSSAGVVAKLPVVPRHAGDGALDG